MGNIIKSINAFDEKDLISKVNSKTKIQLIINDIEIELNSDDLIITENPKKNYTVSSTSTEIVAIYTEITEDLKNEGIVRDLIRQVQNLRKDSGLKVEDRIYINMICDISIEHALNDNKDYFMNEVLGTKVNFSHNILQHQASFKINGSPIELSIEIEKTKGY